MKFINQAEGYIELDGAGYDYVYQYKDIWGNTRLTYSDNSKGLKTPLYQIQGTKTNHFEVLMETKRVMDNEIWKITESNITPIGINGEYQSYMLKKANN